ncbi:MAG: M1 family metallopeptidase [Rhodospirillaceae bacterium]|nr:M1 family metallopeptidase [Rhodospirillaceae bacterium]
MLKVLAAVLLSITAAGAAENYPHGQLPDDIIPTHYALDLTVIPDQQGFSGKATIDVHVKGKSDVIWMHGLRLTVSNVTLTDGDGSTVPATWREIPKSDGVAKLVPAKALRGPTARIAITYTAPYDTQLEGLYRSDEGGESYVFSQMEPISARVAFPSFDEPRFKTPYDISLTVRESHAAITNTPVVKTEKLADGMKRMQFATSKPLPTYLIAVAVGPLDVVEWQSIPKTKIRDREIPLRGVTAKGKGAQIKYALANTAALVTTLEEYFGTPYPYEKLDIVAATDFSAGAMENAGAIFYREPLLLMDESASLSQKRRYVNVHAHELAHQWFGNLVTPMWWNDIWLNEAFATWMANKVAHTLDPKGEYGRLTLWEALSAMETDSTSNARRIAQPIESNDDIDNAFDSITYEKGGGVLAMFEQFYGVEAFRKGIQLHMKRYDFGNATARDLLQSVADANKDDRGVAAFETFLNQAGVPLITASLNCKGPKPELGISQSRYLPTLGMKDVPAQTQTWKVPLCVSYGEGTARRQTCSLIDQRSSKIPLKDTTCPAWIMPNADGAGYYRFALDAKGWDALTAAADTLTDKEMLAAIDSLTAAFRAGDMNAGDYLNRIKILAARDGGNIAWDAANAIGPELSWIKNTLVSEKSEPAAGQFILDLYSPLYGKLGLDPISALDKSNATQATLLRGPIVNMVAMEGKQPAARAELAKRGAAFLGLGGDGKIHRDAVDPNLLDHALDITVQDVGAPAAEAIFKHLKTERDAITRTRMIGALVHSTDPAIAKRVRDLALSKELRVNEIPAIVYGGMSERANVAAAWAWFKANYDTIVNLMPSFNRGSVVGVGGRFCTAAEREDYRKFFEPRVEELTGAPRVYAATLESIDRCVALVEKQRANAEAYLTAHQ